MVLVENVCLVHTQQQCYVYDLISADIHIEMGHSTAEKSKSIMWVKITVAVAWYRILGILSKSIRGEPFRSCNMYGMLCRAIYTTKNDDFCRRHHLIKARFNFSMLISFFDFSHDNIILVKDLSNNARRAAIGSLDMCFEIWPIWMM